MVVPFRLWEVNYVYQGGRLIDARVLPITVTRFGIDEGCTAPSISFTDVHGRKARASVNMFYLAEHDAYQEVAQATAAERKEAALDYLQNEALPTLSRLVAAVELLDAAVNQQSDRSTFYWQAKAVLEQLN